MGMELEVQGILYGEDKQHTNGVYAHGELQDEVDYDLVWIPAFGALPYKDESISDGIYDTVFVYPNGNTVKAKTFIWRATEYTTSKMLGTETIIRHRYTKFNGLVVKDGDDEHMKDAMTKWEKCSVYI